MDDSERVHLLNCLTLLAGRLGKAKERIDMAESELNKLIQQYQVKKE